MRGINQIGVAPGGRRAPRATVVSMGKKSKKKRGAGAEAGDSNTLSEKVTELKELRGAQKGTVASNLGK